MTLTKARFTSFEEYLRAEVSDLPEGRFEYWDGELVPNVHLTLMQRRLTITREMPPPRLVVEIVSPGGEKSENYIRDYQNKRDQYAAIGVPEYWIIDPQREWVVVGTLTSGQYGFATFQKSNTICSPTFPILNLTAAQVLEG